MIYLVESIGQHRKFVVAGSLLTGQGGVLAAVGLYAMAIGYARMHFTNGKVDDAFIESLSVTSRAGHVAKILCSPRVRLWHRIKGGYQIHDFLKFNESAAKMKRKRELTRNRKRRERARKTAVKLPSTTPEVTHSVTRDDQRDYARARAPRTTYHVPRTKSTKNARTARRLAPPTTTTAPSLLAWRRQQSKGTNGAGRPNVPVLAALARDVVRQHPDERDDGELESLIKDAAADTNLKYDGRSVGAALVRARKVLAWQRRKARAS